MKATFENSVNVLVKAYLNDTLETGTCAACAVGNLVAASQGLEYIKTSDHVFIKGSIELKWYSLLSKIRGGWQLESFKKLQQDANDEISRLGYTWDDIDKIEAAFELSHRGKDPMFNSLMAVVDVLAEIHSISLEETQQAKALFVK